MHDPDTPYTPQELRDDAQLIAQAIRLYPDSPYLQAAWLRAVGIVRTTARGWSLETPAVRLHGGPKGST